MAIETDYYRLVPYQNILHIETFNAWDEKVVVKYVSDIRSLALKHFSETQWAMFVDRRNWGLGTPEAGKMYASLAGGKFKTALSHAAVVTGSSDLKKWIINNIARNSTVEVACFKETKEARAWLISYGYDVPPMSEKDQTAD